jgi:transcriptional regulator with XRE-family HTH domain
MPGPPKRQIDQRSATDVDLHVGLRLRERRILLGIGQQALARTLGVSFQQVQKYEKGGNRVSASRLYQLAQALGVPITWFFEGIDVGRGSTGLAPELSQPVDPEVLRFVEVYYRIKNVGARSRLREMASVLAGEK